MEISITTNNKVYSVRDELGFDSVSIDEAVEMFRGLLVCAGFHPSNVDNQFNLDYAWFTQEERDDFYSFFKELNHFNDITKDEMDFQLEMKCGKDIECRTEYANEVVEGFTQGFDNIFMLNEVQGDGLSEYAEEYLSDSDVLLDMCFDKANG